MQLTTEKLALKDRVIRLFEAEEREQRQVFSADEAPPRYEAITAEWLTEALGQGCPDARVVAHRLDVNDDGTSNRRRIFITWNEAGQRAGLPETVFGKASQGLLNRIQYAFIGCGEIETNFYTRIRPELDIEAPTAHFALNDPVTFNSIILLRDMAGEVDFCDYDTDINLDRARQMLSLLAKLHSTFYLNDRSRAAEQYFRIWPDRWVDILQLGFEEYCDLGFAAGESVIPARLFKRRAEIWPATMKAVERHLSLPRSLGHGDVHLKNWYVTWDGRMGLSDWQSPSFAHWSRDIAYAMTAALKVEDRRAWEDELVAHYLEKLQEGGVPTPPLEEAWVLIRQQMMTALAYWTITLRPSPDQPDMQPEDATLAFIERISTAIDDHQALDSFE